MSTIIRLPRKSGVRAPSGSGWHVDWMHPVNQGLLFWYPAINGIRYDVSGRYRPISIWPSAYYTANGIAFFDLSSAPGDHVEDNLFHFSDAGYLAISVMTRSGSNHGNTINPIDLKSKTSNDYLKFQCNYNNVWSAESAAEWNDLTNALTLPGMPASTTPKTLLARVDDGANGSATFDTFVTGEGKRNESTTSARPNVGGLYQVTLKDDASGTDPRGFANYRAWAGGVISDTVAETVVEQPWVGLWQKTKLISLPASAAAATTSTVLRTTKKSGERAPSSISGINWASPLAEGLIHAVAGGYDSTARDLVTGEAMTLGTGTTRAAGKLGRALDFNGTSNATAKLSTTSFSDASPFTMASWFQLKNLSNPTSSVSLHQGTDNLHWHVLAWSPGVPAFRFGVRDGSNYFPAVASYSPSVWEPIFQVGVVHGTTDRRQYINGVEDGTVSDSVDVTLTSIDFFNLGTLHTASQINGSVLLHAAMVWDQRALSASDVAALYSPKYRWDIYQQGTRTISLPAAASTGLTTIRRKL